MNISRISLTGSKQAKQHARHRLAATEYDSARIVRANLPLLAHLRTTPLRNIDRSLKHGGNLTYREAFCGNCYTLSATNRFLYRELHAALKASGANGSFTATNALAGGVAFMQLMAAKESLRSLTSDEIAGMTAAGFMDLVFRLNLGREITETCGMGGDTGFRRYGTWRKSINASTLSAVVLASLGIPTVKHGSYGNTSAIGSTDAMEDFGARVDTASVAEFLRIWRKSEFCYFDAHACKTIHDLSHLIGIETVNHIIGPMTPPIAGETTINKLMGVNEKVHPETIVRAYNILHARGVQKMGGIVVMTGLDRNGDEIDVNDRGAVRAASVFDEVSPFATVVSVGCGGTFLCTDCLQPKDFGVTIELSEVLVDNTPEAIRRANRDALWGKNTQLSNYLAMNSALALFAARHAGTGGIARGRINRGILKECYSLCRRAIRSGKAGKKLREYVNATGGTLSAP